MRMRHEIQREDHHCAVACIAMITGCDYDVVLESTSAFDDFENYGASNAEIACWLSSWFQLVDPKNPPWRYQRTHPYRAWDLVDLANWPRASHIISIRERSRGPCHVVVVARGRVYDPEFDVSRAIAQYERSHFRLIGVVGGPDVVQAALACIESARP